MRRPVCQQGKQRDGAEMAMVREPPLGAPEAPLSPFGLTARGGFRLPICAVESGRAQRLERHTGKA